MVMQKNPRTNKQTKKTSEDSEIFGELPGQASGAACTKELSQKPQSTSEPPVRAACTPEFPPEGKREAEPMSKPVPVLHTKPVPVPNTKPVPASRTKSVVMPKPEFLPRRLHMLGLNS